MAVTLEQAVAILNLEGDDGDLDELELYVDTANEWVATKVSDTTPSPVKLATLEVIRQLWATQRGIDASPLVGDDVQAVNTLAPFASPLVLELLGPYMHKATPVGLANFPPVPGWPDAVEWWLEPNIVGHR